MTPDRLFRVTRVAKKSENYATENAGKRSRSFPFFLSPVAVVRDAISEQH